VPTVFGLMKRRLAMSVWGEALGEELQHLALAAGQAGGSARTAARRSLDQPADAREELVCCKGLDEVIVTADE
jgi:hypothetical protein